MSPERAAAPPGRHRTVNEGAKPRHLPPYGSAAEADLVPVHVAMDRFFAYTVLVRDLLGGFDPARRDLRSKRVQGHLELVFAMDSPSR